MVNGEQIWHESEWDDEPARSNPATKHTRVWRRSPANPVWDSGFAEIYDLGTIEARSNGRSGSRTTEGFRECRRSNNMRRSK